MSEMVERVARALAARSWEAALVDVKWHDFADDARAAIEAMNAWQDISTAPKDGTVFIIGREDAEHHSYVGAAAYERGFFREPGDFPARRWASPTHWQPLPLPPTSPRKPINHTAPLHRDQRENEGDQDNRVAHHG